MAEKRNVVLFVDDEQHILNAIRRATIDESFDTVFAGSGATALQALEQQEISVIVTDMRMPVMDGLTLLKIVREKYPSIVRIVLSGYTQLSQVLSSINQGEIFQFIPKPWQMEEELLWTIRRAIERYNMETERNSLQASLTKKTPLMSTSCRKWIKSWPMSGVTLPVSKISVIGLFIFGNSIWQVASVIRRE